MNQSFTLGRLMVLMTAWLFCASSDVFAMEHEGKYVVPAVNRNIPKDTRPTGNVLRGALEFLHDQEKLFDHIANLLTYQGSYVQEILGSKHDIIRKKIHPHMKRSDKDPVTLLGRTVESIIKRNKFNMDRKDTQNLGAEIDAKLLKFLIQSGVKYVPSSGDNKRFETMSRKKTYDEMWNTLSEASTNPSDCFYQTYIDCILRMILSEQDYIKHSCAPLLDRIGKMLEQEKVDEVEVDEVIEPDASDMHGPALGDITERESSRNNSPARGKKEDQRSPPKHTSPKRLNKENKEPNSPKRLGLSPKRRLSLGKKINEPSVSEEVIVQEIDGKDAKQQQTTADTEVNDEFVDEGDTPEQCDEQKEPVTELGMVIDELCEKNAQYDAQYVPCYNDHEAMLKKEAGDVAVKIRSLMRHKVAYVPASPETASETVEDSYAIMIKRLHAVADNSKELSLVRMLFQCGLLAKQFLLYDQLPYHRFDHLIALFTESCLRIDDVKMIVRDEHGINWYIYLGKFWQAIDTIVAQIEAYTGVDNIHEVIRDEKTPETFLAGLVEYIVRKNVEYRDMPEDKLKIMADRYVAILLYFENKQIKYVSQFDLKHTPEFIEKMSLEESYKPMASTLTHAADQFKEKKLAYFITRHPLFVSRFDLSIFNTEMDYLHYNPAMPDTVLKRYERGGLAGYHLTSRRAERAAKAAQRPSFARLWAESPQQRSIPELLAYIDKRYPNRSKSGCVRGR